MLNVLGKKYSHHWEHMWSNLQHIFSIHRAVSEADHAKLIARGSITNTLHSLVSAFIAFVTIPLVINAVGKEQYGLLILAGSFVGILGFADLGLLRTLVHAVSGDRAKQRLAQSGGVLIVAMGLLVAVAFFAITLVAVLQLAGIPILSILGVPSALQTIAGFVFFLTAGTWAVNTLLSGVIRAGFQGCNQVPTYNGVSILYTAVFGVAYVLFLLTQPSLISITWFLFGSALIRFALLMYEWSRFNALVSWKVTKDSFRSVRKLLQYSPALVVSAGAAAFIGKSDALAASYFLGLSSLAAYYVAFRLFQLPSMGTKVTDALFSSAVEISTKQDTKTLQLLYQRMLRLSLVARVSIVAVIFIYARPAIVLWVGEDFLMGFDVLLGLAALFITYGWTGPHVEFSQAMGWYRMLAGVSIIHLAAAVLLYIFFVPKLGIAGIPIAMAVANMLIVGVWLPLMLYRRLGVHPHKVFFDFVRRMFVPVLVFSFVGVVLMQHLEISVWSAGVAMIHICAFLYVTFRCGLLKSEQNFVLSKIFR